MPRSVPAPIVAPFTPAHLEHVAELLSTLHTTLDDPDASQALVVQLTVPDEPIDHGAEQMFALRSGGDPALVLRGTWVEPPFDGVAIVGRGTARRLPDPVDPTGKTSPLVTDGPSRISFSSVFHRSGANVTRVVNDTGVVEVLSTDGTQPAGRFDDACRRALGLPTARPIGSTHSLWTALWLDDLVGRSLLGELHDWDDVVLAHPAAQMMARTEAADLLRPERLLIATDHLATSWTWADLRLAVATGDRTLPGMLPEDGEWFDDGSFARAVHDELLEPRSAMGLLGDALDPSAHDQLRQVVEILLVPAVWGTPTRDGLPT